MSRAQTQRVHVPEELRELLLEFTINYLLEQPADIVAYGLEYFTRLRESGTTPGLSPAAPQGLSSPEESIISQEEEPPVSRFNTRRKSVFAETYDPEEDEEENTKVVFPKSDEQRNRLSDAVKNILLFRSLDKDQMNEVLDAMFEKDVTTGDIMMKQGDDGDNFYVIQSGIYTVWVQDASDPTKKIHTYENSGSFGELALLYNMPRAATIKAESDGKVWGLDRQTFRRILLKSAFKKRKMYETLIETVPMLKTLQPYERMNLADALVPCSFSKGETIIRQGDVADGMYFIEGGTVVITVQDDNGRDVEINRLGKGGYFGELALVTHRPRAATAVAAEDLSAAFLDVQAFERLLGPCMQIMKRNISDYEEQMLKIFGSKANIKDVR